MNWTEENLQNMKEQILNKVDRIYLLSNVEGYVPKYLTEVNIEEYSNISNDFKKRQVINIREFFRSRINIKELTDKLTEQELKDVEDAYEYSRIQVKILYNLPLD